MKLSEYAKLNSLCYKTALNHYHRGMIPNAVQLATGTIVIKDDIIPIKREYKVATYARVSTSENKKQLDTQSDRLVSFANAKGFIVSHIVKEIASGLNDKRPKLNDLLIDKSIDIIIVEHSDRLTRFGYNYIETLLKNENREILVMNPTLNDKDDIIEDFVSIITSFCARIYGQRRNKRRTEKLIADLQCS